MQEKLYIMAQPPHLIALLAQHHGSNGGGERGHPAGQVIHASAFRKPFEAGDDAAANEQEDRAERKAPALAEGLDGCRVRAQT